MGRQTPNTLILLSGQTAAAYFTRADKKDFQDTSCPYSTRISSPNGGLITVKHAFIPVKQAKLYLEYSISRQEKNRNAP